jgi:hypothetical protein
MGAAIQQAKEFALDVKHGDRASIDREKFSRARRQLIDAGDDVPAHAM